MSKFRRKQRWSEDGPNLLRYEGNVTCCDMTCHMIGLRVFCVGNGGFLRRWVGWGFFCDGRCWGFFATVPGGFFATVAGFFGYGKEGYLHQWGFSATVTGVYYIGAGPQRSGASRRLIFVGDCDKQEAAIHCWAPLLGAIAGRHCWMPLLGVIAGVPLLGATMRAIAGVPWPGCHGWMLATNLGGVHVGRHCWLLT